MRLAAAVGAAMTLALPGAWAKCEKPMLAIDVQGSTARLARFDPVTLAKLPGRRPVLGRFFALSSLSPSGARLVGGEAGMRLRVIDVRAMRVAGDVTLAGSGSLYDAEWVTDDRVLATIGDSAAGRVVAVVDAAQRRVVRKVPIEGIAQASVRFQGGAAFLLAASAGFEKASVALFDADGNRRTVTLDVLAGTKALADGRIEVRQPGLAADPVGRRVFVVDADFTVAEIDVDSLAVTYHRQSTRSLAKFAFGRTRTAHWLGNGLLAVSGYDLAGGYPGTPAGLRLVDTHAWTWQVVDPKAESFQVASGVLVADPASLATARHRVTVYTLGGARRYAVDLQRNRSLTAQGRYAYVCHGRGLLRVLDATTGAKLRVFTREPLPDCPRFVS